MAVDDDADAKPLWRFSTWALGREQYDNMKPPNLPLLHCPLTGSSSLRASELNNERLMLKAYRADVLMNAAPQRQFDCQVEQEEDRLRSMPQDRFKGIYGDLSEHDRFWLPRINVEADWKERGIWLDGLDKYKCLLFCALWKHQILIGSYADVDAIPNPTDEAPTPEGTDRQVADATEPMQAKELHHEASKPLHQFKHQVQIERERIREQIEMGISYHCDIMSEPRWSRWTMERVWIEEQISQSLTRHQAEVDDIAYHIVRDRWVRQSIWFTKWTDLPGMEWMNELPFDQVSGDDAIAINLHVLSDDNVKKQVPEDRPDISTAGEYLAEIPPESVSFPPTNLDDKNLNGSVRNESTDFPWTENCNGDVYAAKDPLSQYDVEKETSIHRETNRSTSSNPQTSLEGFADLAVANMTAIEDPTFAESFSGGVISGIVEQVSQSPATAVSFTDAVQSIIGENDLQIQKKDGMSNDFSPSTNFNQEIGNGDEPLSMDVDIVFNSNLSTFFGRELDLSESVSLISSPASGLDQHGALEENTPISVRNTSQLRSNLDQSKTTALGLSAAIAVEHPTETPPDPASTQSTTATAMAQSLPSESFVANGLENMAASQAPTTDVQVPMSTDYLNKTESNLSLEDTGIEIVPIATEPVENPLPPTPRGKAYIIDHYLNDDSCSIIRSAIARPLSSPVLTHSNKITKTRVARSVSRATPKKGWKEKAGDSSNATQTPPRRSARVASQHAMKIAKSSEGSPLP